MTYIRFFFVLYWFARFLKFGLLPSENPRRAPVLEILTKRSHTFYKPVDVHSVTDFINKHGEYCESVR